MTSPLSPVSDYVDRYITLQNAHLLGMAHAPSLPALPPIDPDKPTALLLSPHPDDEVLMMGGIALRLRLAGWRVVNLAVTLGSAVERKSVRKEELREACTILGYDRVIPCENGYDAVHPTTAIDNPRSWQTMVEDLAQHIEAIHPSLLVLPHAHDGHVTHQGTHHLGLDALRTQKGDGRMALIEAEYWHPHTTPNLMVDVDAAMATRLLTALCQHKGEITRNDYHQRFLGYLADNVRRGSEYLGGKGSQGAAFVFANLYRHGFWHQGQIRYQTKPCFLASHTPLSTLWHED